MSLFSFSKATETLRYAAWAIHSRNMAELARRAGNAKEEAEFRKREEEAHGKLGRIFVNAAMLYAEALNEDTSEKAFKDTVLKVVRAPINPRKSKIV